jgi:hypothetical protein
MDRIFHELDDRLFTRDKIVEYARDCNGQRALEDIDAVRKRHSDRSGTGRNEAPRKEITLIPHLLNSVPGLIETDTSLSFGRFSVSSRAQRANRALGRLDQQREACGGPNNKPPRTLGNMEAHGRTSLHYLNVLRVDAMPRGDDNGVAGAL